MSGPADIRSMATRPTLDQIFATVMQTVNCQFDNTKAGQTLAKLDPTMLASLKSQVVNNIAAVVDVMITKVTGIES